MLSKIVANSGRLQSIAMKKSAGAHCEKIINVPLYRMTLKIKSSLTLGNFFLYDSCRVQCILFTVKPVMVYLISMSFDNNKE